jgi:hypothetical protein
MTTAAATKQRRGPLHAVAADKRGRMLPLVAECESMLAGCKGDPVDEAAGVIRGVKIVGLRSKNHPRVMGMADAPEGATYGYTPEALRRAIPLYEGAAVYVDHPDFPIDRGTGERFQAAKVRSVDEKFGWLSNVRLTAEGLVGDLNYLRSHPLAERVVELARRRPDHVFLSHNGLGKPERRPNGDVVVTEIAVVNSVDLVADRPGTTRSLFETETRTVNTDDFAAGIETEDGAAAGDPMANALNVLAGGDMKKAALLQVIIDAVNDTSLDVAGTTAKVKEALKAMESAGVSVGGGSAEAEEEPVAAAAEGMAPETAETNKTAAGPMIEQLASRFDKWFEKLERLVETVVTRSGDSDLRTLCESHDVAPTDLLVKSLRPLNTSERTAFLQTMPKRKPATDATGKPLVETVVSGEQRRNPGAKKATAVDPAALANAARRGSPMLAPANGAARN